MSRSKLTFALPEELAARFRNRVRRGHRSHFVALALAEKLARQDKHLIRACAIASQDPGVGEIEKEFDSLQDEIAERWKDAASR